jgi:hypothetical protein
MATDRLICLNARSDSGGPPRNLNSCRVDSEKLAHFSRAGNPKHQFPGMLPPYLNPFPSLCVSHRRGHVASRPGPRPAVIPFYSLRKRCSFRGWTTGGPGRAEAEEQRQAGEWRSTAVAWMSGARLVPADAHRPPRGVSKTHGPGAQQGYRLANQREPQVPRKGPCLCLGSAI